MKIFNAKFLIIIALLLLFSSYSFARSVTGGNSDKKFDLIRYHNVGNIWMRVSNYGFFGSGDDIQPQWPSLEYPGGSGIDYLYQGALWFGAKKIRRNAFGEILFWVEEPENEFDVIPESDPDWQPYLDMVVDTLVTVGFDGDADLYEFLPAYNPLEISALGQEYSLYNIVDTIMTASIRKHRRGIDDDADGQVDEDPVGYAFPFRITEELPSQFASFGGEWLSDIPEGNFGPVYAHNDIWFPLGFVDLSDETNTNYNFAEVNDDDDDGLKDEDGYPVSEQDFISFYFDYSPFGTSGERDWGGRAGNNHHGVYEQLQVRIRQMSYQWSYDYIKNLVYVEFNITNMSIHDDYLYDCAMGIYMDSDVGPQAYDGDTRSLDDISSYVAGSGYEFAYTYDADQDQGLTTGYVGSRVCTPDPDSLVFACWYWNRGDGPDDGDPLNLNPDGPTANEKYWLLTGQNPKSDRYISLRDYPNSQINDPDDTRYLFAFYGDMQGLDNPTTGSWNLAPGKTMKIVIAVFPGESIVELKTQSVWAKTIYGQAQTLTTVIEPDIFIHYEAPEPPAIPNMFAELVNDGNAIDVYWDNGSQMVNSDNKTVTNEDIGWRDDPDAIGLDSHIDRYAEQLAEYGYFPEEFAPSDSASWNNNALVNPWTGDRLRHDFQGYALWGRSGSGSQEHWMLMGRWDKKETTQDEADYIVNLGTDHYKYFGGSGSDWYKDNGLPNPAYNFATEEDTLYYHFDELYKLIPYETGDEIYGNPLYDADKKVEDIPSGIYNWSDDDQSLWFKHPDIRDDIYLNIYDDKLIPLKDHLGQNYVDSLGVEDEDHIKDRLSRRYYSARINNPPKGIEYYVAATAWDRGIPSVELQSLESGRDADANMKVLFPGPSSKSKMDNIYVVPNPYVGQSKFDGRRSGDEKGDKSRRLWFVNIPERCKIKIFTLAGDLVDVINHNGAESEDIISISKAAANGVVASGIASWNLLSKNNQIIAAGVYLFSVKDLDSGDIKVGKFVIIK
ncbi:MAG: hypothetical protein K8R49_05470 [Candidatus Cloacimonetes bacterium]|nr:hypothetical protein [Candidatus Cloacimonadota bacterium]